MYIRTSFFLTNKETSTILLCNTYYNMYRKLNVLYMNTFCILFFVYV